MNFSELRTEVFRRLGESQTTPIYWTLSDVNRAINDGYLEISSATEWYECSKTIYPDTDRTYFDLRDVVTETPISLKRVYNPETSQWMEWVDVRDLDYHTSRQWERVYGEPQKVFVRGLFNVGTFPKRATEVLTYADPINIYGSRGIPRHNIAGLGYSAVYYSGSYGEARFIVSGISPYWGTVKPKDADAGYWGCPRYDISELGMGNADGTWGNARVVVTGIYPYWGIARDLEVTPIPKALTIYYSAMPSELSADTDEPGFPTEFQQGIVEYALMALFAEEGQSGKATNHFKAYMAYETSLFNYVKGRIDLDRVGVLYG